MTQYGFYFDSTRCTGCRTCEMACKDYHDLSTEAAFRRVFDYEGGDWKDNGDGTFEPTSWAYHVSMACNHCAMPACVANCPQGALEKDADTGLVSRRGEVHWLRHLREKLSLRGARSGHRDHEIREMRRLRLPRGRGQDADLRGRLSAGPSSSGTSKKLRAAHPGTVDGIAPWLLRMRRSPLWPFWPARPPKTAVTPPAPSRIRRKWKTPKEHSGPPRPLPHRRRPASRYD